jgi:hypothetical protein
MQGVLMTDELFKAAVQSIANIICSLLTGNSGI